jgi:hypothetical protein
MNPKMLQIALVIAVLCLMTGATSVLAQDPAYRIVPITMHDAGTGSAIDTFGVHVNATYCNDGLLNPGGFFEEEMPPFPPPPAIGLYFIDSRNGSTCLGTGMRLNLQEGGKVDTFRIQFQPGDGGYPVTFSWAAGLDADWNSLVFQDLFGGAIININMLTATSAVAPTSAFTGFQIIGNAKNITLDVRREGEVLPQKFELQQNYPNPFNPSTTIRFAIEKTAFASVSVYNVIGQKVRTLASEVLTPGFYTTTWNGTDDNGQPVTTGVYFVRMVASGDNAEFSDLRKLMLVK